MGLKLYGWDGHPSLVQVRADSFQAYTQASPSQRFLQYCRLVGLSVALAAKEYILRIIIREHIGSTYTDPFCLY